MKIGIIGAMDEEIELLKEAMRDVRETRVARMCFFEGTLEGTPVVLVACFMGKVNAAVASQILIDRFGATHLVFTGVAGSLDTSIGIGDIVVSTDCVHHDVDATGLGWAPGNNPDIDMTVFPADERLRAAALRAAAAACPDVAAVEGRVATGDQFVSDCAIKERIVELFGARCCEMEGAGLAQTAWLNDVPYVVIRAISDNADDEGGVDFRTFLTDSSRRCAALVKHLVASAGDFS